MRNTILMLLCVTAGAAALQPARAQTPPRRIEAPAHRIEIPLEAETVIWGPGGSGWLGFSWDISRRTMAARDSARTTESVIVREVRKGSPAEKGGLQHGDTIVSLNGLTANERLVRSLASFLEPGDTVRLRIRRVSRDQQLTLIAAKRPDEFAFTTRSDEMPRVYRFDGDSVRSRMRVFLDSARFRIDSMRLPQIRVERNDSGFTRIYTWSGDGKPDTLIMKLDTLSWKRFPADSMRVAFEHLTPMLGNWETVMDGMPGMYEVGRRAIAGAELAELTPGLGEYFGTNRGVLVLRVSKETPAGEAGLEAGDVILKVGTADVGTIEEVRRAVSQRGREAVKLQVLRKKKPVSVELKRE
jgi:membrane-associated protease RseP (regulator of RpoE activity)